LAQVDNDGTTNVFKNINLQQLCVHSRVTQSITLMMLSFCHNFIMLRVIAPFMMPWHLW